MAIDPSSFHPINVADTCSVWNILSSRCLHEAAVQAGCEFCITSFVQYECLTKPRKTIKASDTELKARLVLQQTKGKFKHYHCDIADLQTVQLLEARRRLGKGELSSIAFAMKINQALITDDQKARRLATDAGHSRIQTTPHLFSWLIFAQRLSDSDLPTVIAEHKAVGLPLAPHFEEAYRQALMCRLNARPMMPGN